MARFCSSYRWVPHFVPVAEVVATHTVNTVPTLIFAAGMGTAALLASLCGVLLDSILAQARRAYELELTAFRVRDVQRVRTAPPVPSGRPADPRAGFSCRIDEDVAPVVEMAAE